MPLNLAGYPLRSYVDQFEKAFSKYLGGGYSVTTSSGTTALELALKTFQNWYG